MEKDHGETNVTMVAVSKASGEEDLPWSLPRASRPPARQSRVSSHTEKPVRLGPAPPRRTKRRDFVIQKNSRLLKGVKVSAEKEGLTLGKSQVAIP